MKGSGAHFIIPQKKSIIGTDIGGSGAQARLGKL